MSKKKVDNFLNIKIATQNLRGVFNNILVRVLIKLKNLYLLLGEDFSHILKLRVNN